MTKRTLKNQLLRNYTKEELRMANRLLAHHVSIASGITHLVKPLSFSERSLDSLDHELKQVLGVDLLA